ncbi:flavodoxin domain-containing protein [bacterium]|nr:flavodoxin domain-containing protein [bacterium]
MKTLIIYASMHGCTQQAAEKLKPELSGEVKIQNLKEKTPVFIDAFDTVIIGGSIHAGRIQKSVINFCKNNLEILLQKKVGLFICCMDKNRAQEQFDNAFPDLLRRHARAKGLFGGAFDFNKMNFLQKAIVRKVSGIEQSVEKINKQAISDFVHQIQ